jgi:hypothetical protein
MDDPALKDLWVPAMLKELHCLAQGKEGVTVDTNTIFYLTHDEIRCIPKDRTATYARIVIDHRLQKDDPNQVQKMVGGNLINYLYKLTTQTADMVSAKIMWNSVISTPGAKFGGANIKTCILKRLLIDTSTCKCPSSSSQTTSFNITISRKKHSMAMFTWRFDRACTGYHKPEY